MPQRLLKWSATVTVAVMAFAAPRVTHASVFPALTEGQAATLPLGTVTLDCPMAGNPDETVYADCDQLASQYTAAVDWGDGGGFGTATKQPCARFSGSCTYSVSA